MHGSILLGLEVNPLGMGVVGLFGLLMGAVGYFVARTHRAPKEVTFNGLQFPHRPELNALEGAGSEQRQHPRFETQSFKLRLMLDQGGPEIEGLVLNQSLGGVCICVQQNLPEGSVLNLRDAESAQPRTKSRVLIKHCRPHRGGWALGCQYI
ncbi:hypothetical protein BH10PLA2_BH10PLA2_37230 [soil metagenome]